MTVEPQAPSFSELGLSEPILQALTAVGYESPSPIQAQTIPLLLSGADVLGQAQTGTGKTAAFALPVLARIDVNQAAAQALVLVPTRELAIQVAEAFQKYAANLKGFHVLPIYGGQSYTPQLKGLKRGAHVIVGTPGRVMDHIKSGAMKLATLRYLVLDEGDEMLQMGFVDDIEWILEQIPPERQIALFSATMPPAIRRIAQKHMRDPQQVTIQNRGGNAPKIRQRYWLVSGMHKLDALTRMLEVERFDAMLVFVRTKLETVDLADRLEARGFSAAALNGDIAQQQREKTVNRLKNGQLDIVVATDVAARGLDVDRISHVVNYDIPYDSETYVHRIGRTGRAGRSGEAILFVSPRERNMLRVIERVTKQQIEPMSLPSVQDVNEQRVLKFKERVTAAVQSGEGKPFHEVLGQMERDQNIPAIEIAAAIASMLQGSAPFLLSQKSRDENGVQGAWAGRESANDNRVSDERGPRKSRETREPRASDSRPPREPRHAAPDRERAEPRHSAPARDQAEQRHPSSAGDQSEPRHFAADAEQTEQRSFTSDAEQAQPRHFATNADQGESHDASTASESGDFANEAAPREDRDRDFAPREPRARQDGPPMETYRLEVGHMHGVLPGNIVGAIANEAGLDGKHIGHIDIRDDHTFVDLPEGMPKEIFQELKKVRVRGTEMRISKVDSKPPRPERTGHSVRPRNDRDDRPPRAPGEGGKPGGFKPGGFKAGGFKPGGFKRPGGGAAKHKGPRKPSSHREH